MDYSRGIAYDYAAGTEQAWDRLMQQEDRDTAKAEARSPKVWKPEDGHVFRGKPGELCALCAHHRNLHIEEKS